jgi:hypothetical protein
MSNDAGKIVMTDWSFGIWKVLTDMLVVEREWERIWFELVSGDDFSAYIGGDVLEKRFTRNWYNATSPKMGILLQNKAEVVMNAIDAHEEEWNGYDLARQGLYFALLFNGYRYEDITKVEGDDLERIFILSVSMPYASWNELHNIVAHNIDFSLASSFKGLNNAL